MNSAIVSTVSQARTWGRSGAPLAAVCSIWLLLDIVLDPNLVLPSAISIAGRKGLADGSGHHVEPSRLGKGLLRLGS